MIEMRSVIAEHEAEKAKNRTINDQGAHAMV